MIGRVLGYLWALASIAILVTIWYSGVHYGKGQLEAALKAQDKADMAACREAWRRWGH